MRACRLELDDRREIVTLLEKLRPGQRVQFLAWACRQVKNRGNVRVTHHGGSANEAYLDLLQLEVVYGLDLHAACRRLERLVRRG